LALQKEPFRLMQAIQWRDAGFNPAVVETVILFCEGFEKPMALRAQVRG
jgi:hypothetical protein